MKDTFKFIPPEGMELTNRNSANWYLKIGNDSKHVIIAGCQVHYAVKSDKPPSITSKHWETDKDKVYQADVPSRIYIAE